MTRKPMTLRLLPVGFDFYLTRTGQRFTLISAGPSALGGIKYVVHREGAKGNSVLHHSCQIKPVVKWKQGLVSGPQGPQIARQGHRYLWNEMHVIALETGARVKVLAFTPSEPWSEYTTFVNASELMSLPMAYFGGQVPQ